MYIVEKDTELWSNHRKEKSKGTVKAGTEFYDWGYNKDYNVLRTDEVMFIPSSAPAGAVIKCNVEYEGSGWISKDDVSWFSDDDMRGRYVS